MANLVLKNNTIANAVSLEFNRDTNASWRIVNDGNNLYLRCNYTTEVGDYYNVVAFSYNSGEMATKGRITAPSLTLSSASSIKHIKFSRAGWNYINIPAGGTIAFSFSDATSMSSDEVQQTMTATGFYPNINNQLNLGSSSQKWAKVYATNFVGALTGNADTASQFQTATTVTLTGDVTGTSAASTRGWSITTTIGANNHAHDTSASWSNRELTVSVGGGGSAAKASIPATLSGFSNITSTHFTGALVGNADTATQFASATTVALTGAVTGTSSASTRGWSITTSIARGVSWNNRTIKVTIGNGTASGTIPETLTGFTSITSATLIASTTMQIPVKASTYTSSTAGEIWIVA